MGKKAAGPPENGFRIYHGLTGDRWRELAESLADTIFLVDAHGRIQYLNRVPGGADPGTLIGRSVFEFISRGHRPRAGRALRKAVVSFQQDKYEAKGVSPDGTVNWYEVTVGPIQSGEHTPGAILTARNINERKKKENKRRIIRRTLETDAMIRAEALKRANLRLSREMEVRRATEARLRKSQQHLRQLYFQLEHTRESERIELAHNLHDELGTTLTALKLNIQLLLDETPCPESAHVHMREEISSRLDKAINDIRYVIQRLRPPVLDDLGLIDAVRWQAGEMSEASGLSIQLEIDPEEFSVEEETATHLFRIFQEILTNIVRHARASRVMIRLRRGKKEIILNIKDDGRGMPGEGNERGHSMGIRGIRERIKYLEGSLRIRNLKNSGTAIRVRVPAPDLSPLEVE